MTDPRHPWLLSFPLLFLLLFLLLLSSAQSAAFSGCGGCA